MEFYDLELKLKSYLTKHKIRLCDSPYTVNNDKGNEITVLANSLSKEFQYEISHIEQALNNLRIKSINNINSQDKYQQESIVSIKIHQTKSIEDLNLEIRDFHNVFGLQLINEISNLLGCCDDVIKVIYRGKLIKEDDLLVNQGLRNNSKVMVLHISKETVAANSDCLDFGKNKDMAEYLAQRSIDGKFQSDFMNVEITNQSGEVLKLSNSQKSLLTYGLMMHQQAAGLIRNNQHQIALLHCLEADEAFLKSEYCDSIDNAAILQLDIVWCYYCIQNMDDLPNAKKRLDVCEKRMKKCYGEGNERIKRIREKKSFEGVPESIHVFRLYLLKAIVAFYENDVGSGRENLFKASDVYQSFIIPESLVTEVMLLGFTRNQAIEGLRVSKELSVCVEYILRRIEDQTSLANKRKEEEKRHVIAKRLGCTSDSSRINLDVLERLIEQSHMNNSLCLAAVRRANNSFNDAMELLFANEDQLLLDLKEQQEQGLVVDGDISYEAVLQEKISIHKIGKMVTKDRDIIRKCLRQSHGNVEMAINTLVNGNFTIVDNVTDDNSITSYSSSPGETSSSTVATNITELEREIYETIGDKVAFSQENQYINPDLIHEIMAFNKFARMLNIQEITYDINTVTW